MSLPWLVSSSVVLHAGHGQEVALLEYAYRVLLSLIAIGGVALLAFSWMRVVDTVRSALVAIRARGADDP